MDHVYFLTLVTAIISYGFGFFLGYRFGRSNGYMVGEELERRKWKRRQT